ncbi:MAG: hypothetical protein D3910_07100 [Candidatus Electrothrix sp. ATG2]|nr:hypothetical protein [Candidatus Electrothrix sp. ATG2]
MRDAITFFQPNRMRETTLPKPLNVILITFIVASLITRCFLPAIGPVVMDEFLDTQLSQQLAQGSELYYEGSQFSRMPLLNHLLSWFCDGTQNGFETLVTARRVMLGCSMIIMLFVYLTACRVAGPAVGLLALFTLCPFTTFLDRSFHVRADLLSTMFASEALFFTTLSS